LGNEKGKVEVHEIDLEFCSIHVPYIILPCGYMDILGTYMIGKNRSRVNKLTILGIEQIMVYSSLFTYYKQDIAKSMLLFDYYNNVYWGWYEHWLIMYVIKRGKND
jgi:hypothetical protein